MNLIQKNLLFLLLVLPIQGISQNMYTLPQVTPKSPNVSNVERFGNIPVNLGRGMLNYSIPLYEIKIGGFSFPLILSHQNNGLMTDEVPTWVGHGWSLDFGGLLSYNQRGINDFHPQKGMFVMGKAMLDSFFANSMNPFQRQYFLEDIISGNVDTEYDLYNLKLGEYSTSFYFKNDSSTTMLNVKDVAIVRDSDSSFMVKDNKGNVFYFSAKERGSITNVETNFLTPDFNDVSSYFLTKVKSLNGDSVTFRYKKYEYKYNKSRLAYSHAGYVRNECPGSSLSTSTEFTTMESLLLDSVIFPEGYVVFSHSSEVRKDIKEFCITSNVPSLNEVAIFNLNGYRVRGFKFYTSYFQNDVRLKLDSLKEIGSYNSKVWSFHYNNGEMPPIYSAKKDHWGYANENEGSLIPYTRYHDLIPFWTTPGFQLGNRSSDFEKSLIGTLKSIRYPTGGESHFTYEANKIILPDNSIPDYFGPYLKYPKAPGFSDFTYVSETGATALTGNTIVDSFHVDTSGYYRVTLYKQKSPDIFWPDANIDVSGPSESAIAPLINNCSSEGCAGDSIVWLQAGTYRYTVSGSVFLNPSSGLYEYLIAWLEVKKAVGISDFLFSVGGCRIKEVRDIDSVGNSMSVKKYMYFDSLKSVSFKNIPHYYSENELLFMVTNVSVNSCGNVFKIHEESVYPMAGPVIEYGHVREFLDTIRNTGYVDHFFLFSQNLYGAVMPIVPPTNTSWTSALPWMNKAFDSSANLVMEDSKAFYSHSVDSSLVNGLRAEYATYAPAIGTWRTYRVNLVTLESHVFQNRALKTYSISNNDTIRSERILEYSTSYHGAPIKEVDSSFLHKTQKVTRRTLDINFNSSLAIGPAAPIKQARTLGVNLPVEELVIKNINGEDAVVGGRLSTYYNNSLALEKVYNLEISKPIPIAEFSTAYVDALGVLKVDSRYVLQVEMVYYDSRQNVAETKLFGTTTGAYIYGYNKSVLIAEAKNSSRAEIAYTSFEDGELGGWNLSSGGVYLNNNGITGKRSLNGGVSKTLPLGNYVLSFWSEGNTWVNGATVTDKPIKNVKNGWRYFEKVLNNVTSVQVSGDNIDEVRIYPVGSELSTYTYDALIGMTSKVDAAGNITYYEYDSFGRLSLVRDENNNILKRICYNYAGQTEDCRVYYNVLKNQSFTKNCGTGFNPSPYLYVVPANRYAALTQSAADSLAQVDINLNGQHWADSISVCPTIFYSSAISQNFYKSNCPAGYTASAYPVTVAYGYSTSTISQAYVDSVAQDYAQSYADANGGCISSGGGLPYARLELEAGASYDNSSGYVVDYGQQVAAYIRFYADSNCTVPFTLTASVNYAINVTGYYETDMNYTASSYELYAGSISNGVNSFLFDDMLSYYGFFGEFEDPGPWLYYEKWKDDYYLNPNPSQYILRPTIRSINYPNEY